MDTPANSATSTSVDFLLAAMGFLASSAGAPEWL
jgi:hypothetical protein